MFLTIGLLALQVVAVLGAPIEAEDEPFDFEFSQLGEEMYLVVETRNHTEKLLEEWSDDDGSINPEEMGPFVQGDLYQPVLAKNAVKFKSRKWAKAVVPYKISDSFGKILASDIWMGIVLIQKSSVPSQNLKLENASIILCEKNRYFSEGLECDPVLLRRQAINTCSAYNTPLRTIRTWPVPLLTIKTGVLDLYTLRMVS